MILFETTEVEGVVVENTNVSETCRQINPRIFDSGSSYECFSDETLSGAKLFKRSAELLCHFARGNPPAEQRPWTCSAICISSWLESAPPQISSTYRPYFKGASGVCALHPPLIEGAPEPREKELDEYRMLP